MTPPRPAAVRARARARGRARAAVVAVATLSALLAGCSTASPSPAPVEHPAAGDEAWRDAPRPASIDDVDVTAEVYRTRIDPSRDGIQLTVRNDADAPLALAAARLSTPLLEAEPARDDEALIPPGGARDLPMTLTDPVCPADPAELAAPAPPDAVLVVPLADGSVAELRVPTTDRIGQWGEWFAAACFAEEVADAVELDVRVPPGESAGDPATSGTIVLELVARGRPGSAGAAGDGADVRLLSVAGTVLLGALGADGRPAASIPLELTAQADAERTATLRFAPNRCDAHAIADDKQGTLLRVTVAIGARTGVVTVVADPATKDAIYAAITAACGADD